MDPWCCDTYEEALVYFRDPGTILCGKCSDTEGINSIPVWGIPNINTRFKANRLHRVTEIILRFWGKFHLDSREISLRLSSYQGEVSGASRIYMEISSLYCLRCVGGGWGGVCKVIFMSNPTVVLRLRLGWGFDKKWKKIGKSNLHIFGDFGRYLKALKSS